MTSDRPWTTGSDEQRWIGYFVSEQNPVLRNRLGLTDELDLQGAENDLVEVRLIELRDQPSLIARTYDYEHLTSLHRHLFQDVYDWAGEQRTVGMGRSTADSFMPPGQIEIPILNVTRRLHEDDLLRGFRGPELIDQLADLYDLVNYAHPFRDGNGRTQREFFAQILAESGRGIAWDSVSATELHRACHVARTEMDLGPLKAMFRTRITERPVYPPGPA